MLEFQKVMNIVSISPPCVFQQEKFHEAIDEMLTKLDEFGGLVDMVSGTNLYHSPPPLPSSNPLK